VCIYLSIHILTYDEWLQILAGIQVIFVDMRWGIRDKSSLDHQTWWECSLALEWCKKQSMGIFFLSLQGDKYGWVPLPRVLKKPHVDAHAQIASNVDVDTAAQEEMASKISSWYAVDMNALGEPEYVLRSLTAGDDDQRKRFEAYAQSMVSALGAWRSKIPVDSDRYPDAGLRIGQSVTEWEFRAAVSASGGISRDPPSRDCRWSHRSIEDAARACKSVERGYDYSDGSDKLPGLLSFMQDSLSKESVYHHEAIPVSDIASYASSSAMSNKCSVYLGNFKAFVKGELRASLVEAIARIDAWSRDGCGLGVRGSLLSEMLHHSEWARKKCQDFIGREALVGALLRLIEHPGDPALRQGKKSDAFDGIAACVVGVSGAGKTALMAKVASEVYQRLMVGSSVPVLIRFCGTSAGSRTARDLVISLCHQMEFVSKLEAKKMETLQNEPYDKLVAYFQELLSVHPMYLFIDSLDQLLDADLGRSHISFLKGARPHKDTRIIVSCLPDERETDPVSGMETGRWKYLYLCETRLREHSIPRVTVEMPSDPHDAIAESMGILRASLERRGRTLTDRQWQVVSDRVSEEKEKTALYIHLALGVVSQWDSGVDASLSLRGGIHGLILQLYESLASTYGSHLVRLMLGFIVYSQKGVSHQELEDLLSLDAALMSLDAEMNTPEWHKSIFQYHKKLAVHRVPSHVVVRVLNSMEGLVIVGEDGCLQLYHRQLREVAERWVEAEKQTVCRHLARYFGNLVGEEERDRKKLTPQDYLISGVSVYHEDSVVNRRRCVEAVRPMLECGMLEEAERELCDFAGICGRLRCGEAFSTISDLLELSRRQSPASDRTQHYLRWLQRDVYTLSRSPITMILTSAVNQPKVSMAYREFESSYKNIMAVAPFLHCGRILGTNKNFDTLINELHAAAAMNSVYYSPDGRRLASGSDDGTVRIWDSQSGACLSVLEGHTDAVFSVCYSPDGRRLVSGSRDRMVRIWDVESGSCLSVLKGHNGAISSVCYSPDGRRLASGSDDGTVRIWDSGSGACLSVLEGHTDRVKSMSYSLDGRRLASGSEDGTIRVWDVESGTCLSVLEGHAGNVTSVCYSPDGRRLASGSEDRTVRIWDAESGSCLSVLEGHTKSVNSVCYSPDGRRLASGSEDGTIRIWDVESGACLSVHEGHSSVVWSVCYSPDGRRLASGSYDRTVRIWDAESGTCLSAVEGHTEPVSSVCFSPDGRRLTSGSEDGTVWIWDAVSGACLSVLEGHKGAVWSVSFGPDGRRLAAGSDEVRIWDAECCACLSVLEGRFGYLFSVCFSPDGRRLASGSRDCIVRIWDVESGACLSVLEGHTGGVTSVCYRPDGRRLASGSRDGTVRIWDLESGACLTARKGPTYSANSVSFSPDGRRLASGSDDGTVRIWDAESGTCLSVLEGHTDRVKSACYSPHGRRLASGSEDGTIRVWDAKSGACLSVLKGHSSIVRSLCYSPDGRRLASGSDDHTVRIWEFFFLDAESTCEM
jgi:WD40 repeat protein